LESEKSSLNRASGMQQRIDNQESTIHGLREKRELELERFQEDIQSRAELEIGLKQKLSELETQLQGQAATIESLTKQALSEVKQQLESQNAQLLQQSDDLSSTLEQERNQWQSKLATKSEELSRVAIMRDETEAEVALTKQALFEVKQQLESQSTQLQQQSDDMSLTLEQERNGKVSWLRNQKSSRGLQ